MKIKLPFKKKPVPNNTITFHSLIQLEKKILMLPAPQCWQEQKERDEIHKNISDSLLGIKNNAERIIEELCNDNLLNKLIRAISVFLSGKKDDYVERKIYENQLLSNIFMKDRLESVIEEFNNIANKLDKKDLEIWVSQRFKSFYMELDNMLYQNDVEVIPQFEKFNPAYQKPIKVIKVQNKNEEEVVEKRKGYLIKGKVVRCSEILLRVCYSSKSGGGKKNGKENN
jgi:molecular chaperone GrpE (heat shock protein)